MGSTAEIKRLQSCINDLISVLALPAIWSGSESSQILGTLLDVLLTMLRLDFAYARLSDASDGPPIEAVRLGAHRRSPVQPQQVGQALDRWLTGDQTASRSVVPDPSGEGEVLIASFSLGLQHEVGVLVAGSRRADFPTEVERLLLRVAANQAGIGLQEARRSGEQKRIAEMLEQRVAERTRRLTAVNDELRRSEAYLAEAQRLSHTGSFGWRVSTGEIFWSAETFRIFQYDRTTKPTFELVRQRVHPHDLAEWMQTVDHAAQHGADFDHEYRLRMPDDSVKYVHVVAHAVSDGSSGIEFVGAVMDVTEQHQAKAALEKAFDEIKKSEDRLRLVIDTIPSMVWSGLPDGSFDFINQPWLRYLGCSWEELSARGGLVSVVHPDDVEESVDRWNATRATRRHTDHELRMRRADGQYRWFLARALPLRDEQGNIVRWYGTATDIEDRKRTEEALRQSEEQWRDVFENNPTMYFVVNSAGTVLAVNPFGAEQLSYEVAELVGQPVLRVILDSDREAVQKNIALCFEQLGRARNWEARKVRRDGGVIWVRETARAVARANGPIVLVACEDITEQKRAAEAWRQAQADLAHMSRVTTMGELTASLAHEVNQPIAAAVTNANACWRWLAGDTPNLEEARAAAMRIVKDGTRAAEIISRIRLLFQKGTPQRELVDVNEVIREMIVLLRSEATRYSISVRTELATGLPELMGDPVQLQQVFMNLLLNGIEAMKDVDDKRELLITSQLAEDEQLLISISDTGVGLPPQQADQIFDAFFTTKLQGTGMGLSISRSIIESHGGRLWANGNSPRGATFHIALPTRVEAHQ